MLSQFSILNSQFPTLQRATLRFTRRDLLSGMGAAVLGLGLVRAREALAADSMNVIEFEETLARQRAEHYRHRRVDVPKEGFRPVGGKVADFAVASDKGSHHFFYIERRLTEGTPFYPGHEIYFGHASTRNLADWEVHDPVMLVRPGTWEDGHVWAPCIIRRGDEFLMAYTGVSGRLSQNIGFASSRDLFEWKRWESNPLSPCRNKPWAFWREDAIEQGGRFWLTYTANTRDGASCIAMTSTSDFRSWADHGPICVGPKSGYEPRLEGGHPQGSLESANMVHRGGRWFLVVKAKVRGIDNASWIIESERNTSFDFEARRPFWPGATGVEIVRDRNAQSLLAVFAEGCIRFGVVDWGVPSPTARFVATSEELAAWL